MPSTLTISHALYRRARLVGCLGIHVATGGWCCAHTSCLLLLRAHTAMSADKDEWNTMVDNLGLCHAGQSAEERGAARAPSSPLRAAAAAAAPAASCATAAAASPAATTPAATATRDSSDNNSDAGAVLGGDSPQRAVRNTARDQPCGGARITPHQPHACSGVARPQ